MYLKYERGFFIGIKTLKTYLKRQDIYLYILKIFLKKLCTSRLNKILSFNLLQHMQYFRVLIKSFIKTCANIVLEKRIG